MRQKLVEVKLEKLKKGEITDRNYLQLVNLVQYFLPASMFPVAAIAIAIVYPNFNDVFSYQTEGTE